MKKYKVIDEFNNTMDIVEFEELKGIAESLNEHIINDTPYFEDRQTLLNKDFNNIDDIKETLECANVIITEIY